MTPQDTRVLQELQKGEWFTLGDALNLNPPIYRLSERIRDLEKAGYSIEHGRVPGKPYGRYKMTPYVRTVTAQPFAPKQPTTQTLL